MLKLYMSRDKRRGTRGEGVGMKKMTYHMESKAARIYATVRKASGAEIAVINAHEIIINDAERGEEIKVMC